MALSLTNFLQRPTWCSALKHITLKKGKWWAVAIVAFDTTLFWFNIKPLGPFIAREEALEAVGMVKIMTTWKHAYVADCSAIDCGCWEEKTGHTTMLSGHPKKIHKMIIPMAHLAFYFSFSFYFLTLLKQ